jgi:hypothetical protein
VATLVLVNEVARLQVCDLWFDYLASYGVPGFEGTCSEHIDRQKKDTLRHSEKRALPALGRSESRDPVLDIVAPLRMWLWIAGLAVHQACVKRTRPATLCAVCPPLFPLTRCTAGGVTMVTDRPCSRQQASD